MSVPTLLQRLLQRLLFHHRHHICFTYLSTRFCLRGYSFRSPPSRATTLPKQRSSFSPLPLFFIRQLQGVPCAGDGESVLLFIIISRVPRDYKNITNQSKRFFCLSSLSWIYSLMLLWAPLTFITFPHLLISAHGGQDFVLAAVVLTAWNMQLFPLTLLLLNSTP